MTEDVMERNTRWGEHIARWNARREKERAATPKPRHGRAVPPTPRTDPPGALRASTPASELESSGVGGLSRGG